MTARTSPEPSAVPTAPARGRRVALVVAGLLVLVALAYLLFGVTEPRVAGVSRAVPERPVATLQPGAEACQATSVPAGTGAVQTHVRGTPGPMQLELRGAQGERLASASGGPRFRLDRTLARDTPAQLCLRAGDGPPALLLGDLSNSGLTLDGEPAQGGLALVYYRAGEESTATLLGLVAERAQRLRGAFGGGWRAPVFVLLLVVSLALTVLSARGRAVWVGVATVAICNALAWSLLTPVFQIPDENAHLSYVQDMVEKGQPPRYIGPSLSPQLQTLVDVSELGHVNFNRDARPPWTAGDDAMVERRLDANPDRVNKASYLAVADYPPAYYAKMAPVYRAVTAAGGNTLDAVTPLRAASALFAGVAVLAVFAFLLELFPDRRSLAVLAALICAWHPVFAWISGGVSPDALLIPAGCVMFWLFARAFRRGLTPWLAAALGLTLAVALLTKIAALGFVPGWIAGVALLVWRSEARVRNGAAAVVAAAAPLGAYVLANVALWDRSAIPGALTGAEGVGSEPAGEAASTSLTGFASYLWQYVLPRVGGMQDYFNAGWTPRDLWVPIWVGRFGWSDYQFPTLLNRAALIVYAVIAVAALVVLVRFLRSRPELRAPFAIFALLGLGLVVLVARVGYPLRVSGSGVFEQGRYYMPLIPLYALALVLAAQILSERRARLALAAFLAVTVLHFGGALGLTAKRYYTFSGFHTDTRATR